MDKSTDEASQNAQATDACLAVIMAVEKAGSLDPNPVREQLAKLDEATFFGPMKFSAQGQNVVKPMAVIPIQGGKPVGVWPKASAEAPLKWPGKG